MVALVLAASLQDLSEVLDRTPFKAEYTAWREGLDEPVELTVLYSPPDMARLMWHSREGEVGVSTDGEHFYSIFPGGASSLSMREMSAWLDGVELRLRPRFRALAEACGKPYEERRLGGLTLRIEVGLSRSGNEERPFNLSGGVSLGWKQAKFGWLDQPETARTRESGGVLRIVSGELITEIDSETGILRSLSIVEASGKKVASVERRSLEKGKGFPRESFLPAARPRDSRMAWRALCAGLLSKFIVGKAAWLLPEDESSWRGETGRALDELFSSAADEAIEKLFGAQAVDVLARGYARMRAPKEKVLRVARVSMAMQIRGTGEAPGKPRGALVLRWTKALERRFEEKLVKPVLERLEGLLSKRKTPWR